MPYKVVFCFFFNILVVWFGTLAFAFTDDVPVHFRPDGWETLFHEAGIRVETQSVPSSKFKAYRAKGVLKAPIDQILEALRDAAAAAEWIPDLARQQVVSDISPVEIVTLNIYAVPFPFADRELLLHNHLRLDPVRRALMAEAVSIDRSEAPVARGNVRAHMFCGRTWFRPLDAENTAVELILMVEPRGKIPAFLAAVGLRSMPFKFLKALESRAQTTNYPVRRAFQDLLQQLSALNTDAPKMTTVAK